MGAAAVWFLDPDNGGNRRSVAQAKAGQYARKGKGAAMDAAPVSQRGDASERLNDPGLKAKVESEIFRDADAPKDKVSVNVEDGVVVLRGEVEPEQADRLVRDASDVDGVSEVRNLLSAR